jgi:DNA-binding MarR family transcriptional regulator
MHAGRQLSAKQHRAAHMDSDTVIRLRRVVLRLARQLNAASREEGLTPTQASVLGITSIKGPLSLAELTEIEGINPTMLSRVVGKLDSFGLIRRLRDPDDFRAARVEVTPEGKRRYERISAQRSAIISDCVAGLPADQEAALAAALPAFENLADKLRSTVRDGRNQLIRDTAEPGSPLFARKGRPRRAVFFSPNGPPYHRLAGSSEHGRNAASPAPSMLALLYPPCALSAPGASGLMIRTLLRACRHISRLALPSIRVGSPPWVGAPITMVLAPMVLPYSATIRPAAP